MARGRSSDGSGWAQSQAGTAAQGATVAIWAHGPPEDFATARARVAELERLVGQQQLDLDFFKKPCGHGTGRAEATTRPSLRRHRKNDARRIARRNDLSDASERGAF